MRILQKKLVIPVIACIFAPLLMISCSQTEADNNDLLLIAAVAAILGQNQAGPEFCGNLYIYPGVAESSNLGIAVSDGTEEGTKILKEFSGGMYDPRSYYGCAGDYYFFLDDDGTHGRELWASDGTEEGTFLVKDINPGASNSNPEHFAELNGKAYFSAFDGTNTTLYESDGTESGTKPVIETNLQPRNITRFDNKLYFLGIGQDPGNTSDTDDRELWVSDGTAAGTRLLKNINTDPTGDSNPSEFTVLNDTLYFRAYTEDGGGSYHLWKTDGTESGTVAVTTQTSHSNLQPQDFAVAGDSLYFQGSTAGDRELWMSDGTEGGTTLLKNIRTSPGSSSNPRYLTALNNTLLFQARTDTDGIELWKSDGTNAGTVQLKDINTVSNSSPSYLETVNERVYFRATDGSNGNELWASDGTESGTVNITDWNGPSDGYYRD